MDLRKYNNFKNRAVNQYMPPRCFELAGQNFTLNMDDGYDVTLNFICGETLEIGPLGGTLVRENYKCLKGDDTTYLVSYESDHTEKRTSYLFVIDKANNLVTRQTAVIGENARWPYLINTYHDFGAIKTEGVEYKPYPRHGFTSEMVGNVIEWTYSADMTTVHIYYCTDFYRITYPFSDPSAPINTDVTSTENAIGEMLRSLPSRDEPTRYIKIKDGMYLVSLTEQNAEKILGDKIMFRSNNLTFLQNYHNVTQVGFAFGTSTLPAGDTKTHIGIGAYGRMLDPADPRLHDIQTDPNPFLV